MVFIWGAQAHTVMLLFFWSAAVMLAALPVEPLLLALELVLHPARMPARASPTVATAAVRRSVLPKRGLTFIVFLSLPCN
jgi:hypothetical protein